MISAKRRSQQARPSGEEFLHHALLEGAGLVPPLLQRHQLHVHVGENGGDGGLFGERWERYLEFFKRASNDLWDREGLSGERYRLLELYLIAAPLMIVRLPIGV